MNRKILALLVAVIVTVVADAGADPVLKPRKYYGPIPQQSLTFSVGFLGGAEAAQLLDFLESDIVPPEEARSEDFGNALSFELMYMYKPHPQFGVRANASVAFLKSTGEGFFVSDDPPVLPDTTRALVDYTREFNVDLFTLEASGVYFFADAAVKEFQPYIGGGFTIGFPHATLTENREDDRGNTENLSSDNWSFEPGVHAVLGAFYYVTNRFAFSAEGRVQLLQSKFAVPVFDPDAGEDVMVDFDISYSGFYLTIGVTRAF